LTQSLRDVEDSALTEHLTDDLAGRATRRQVDEEAPDGSTWRDLLAHLLPILLDPGDACRVALGDVENLGVIRDLHHLLDGRLGQGEESARAEARGVFQCHVSGLS